MKYFDIQDNRIIECTDKTIITADIPDGIEEISENAFADCKNLVSVDFPPTLKKIGDGAFCGCTKLAQIDLSYVRILGAYSFSECLSLKSVILGENIGYLPNGVFSDCVKLEEISLPESITYIGCDCFKKCVSVNDFKSDNVMEIDNGAFESCENLYGINLPSSLLHISPDAFANCNNLTDITVSNRYIYIDEDAFKNTNNNLIVRTSQFSNAYKFALNNKIKCKPVIIDGDYKQINRDEVKKLVNAGIMFQMKPYPDCDDKVIIRFDSSQEKAIESVLGGTINDK